MELVMRAALACCLLLLLGCSADAEPEARESEPAPTSAGDTPSAVPPESPLAGQWVAHLRRDRTARAIRKAGLGEWVDKFFEAERWPASVDAVTMVVTLTPVEGTAAGWSGDFQVAYFEPTTDWNPGWKGQVGVEGREMAWTDDFTGVVDRMTFRVEDDRLSLRWQGADTTEFDGYPPKVYAVAYLHVPLTRTTCALDPGVDC